MDKKDQESREGLEEAVSEVSAFHLDWFQLRPPTFLDGKRLNPTDTPADDSIVVVDGTEHFAVPKESLPSSDLIDDVLHKIKSKTRSIRRTDKDVPPELQERGDNIPDEPSRTHDNKFDLADRSHVLFSQEFLTTQSNVVLELPTCLSDRLTLYQCEGIKWIKHRFNHQLGGILADPMGLGKTAQVLGFLLDLHLTNSLTNALVITPKSVATNWIAEARKFTPALPIKLYSRAENLTQGGVLVCSYDRMLAAKHTFAAQNWTAVVFDEAQLLKNFESRRAAVSRSLKSSFKLCVTGTPMENHFGEVHSLIELILPGFLGERAEFLKQFVHEVPLLDDVDALKGRIEPLILRRSARLAKGGIPKNETTITIDFDEEQKQLYRNLAIDFNRQLQEARDSQDNRKIQLVQLEALNRLRQVCSDPNGIPGIDFRGIPPKVAKLTQDIPVLIEKGESALVFTQFNSTYYRIQRALLNNGVQTLGLNSILSNQDRKSIVDLFMKGRFPSVLVTTLKVAGFGLTLTKANHVFLLEPWWNPAVEDQAFDRVHRIGQTKPVFIYRYIMRDSLEDKMGQLKEKKRRRFELLFGEAAIGEHFDGKNLKEIERELIESEITSIAYSNTTPHEINLATKRNDCSQPASNAEIHNSKLILPGESGEDQ